MHSKQWIKILGLSLLAAISVMAVSAASAQAKFELRRNGVPAPEGKLNLIPTVLLGELVAENGLRIHCPEGTGTATLSGGGTATVTGSALVEYKGCVWKKAEKTCTITGGTIHGEGEGLLSMVGSLYLVLATSERFAVVHTTGTFCTIPEEEIVSGGVLLDILNAETDVPDHLVHVEDHGLMLGESGAELTGGEAHVKEVSGATWAIRLTGL